MNKIYEGSLIADADLKFAVVVSKFNEFITSKLLEGSLSSLKAHGAKDENIEVVYVPGAFEIPLASELLVSTSKYDAIIGIGAVIRGSTSHYDYVCNEVSKGIQYVSIKSKVPIAFGVITVESIEQAIERAGTKAGNKGYEAATAAIEMVNLKAMILK